MRHDAPISSRASAGLTDDYAHDGRVLFEVLQNASLPTSARQQRETLVRLANAYKAINAPRRALGRASLALSTRALANNDQAYGAYVSRITALTEQRNAIASSMILMLEGAAFANQPIDEGAEDGLGHRANALIDRVEDLANQDHDDDDHHRHFGE